MSALHFWSQMEWPLLQHLSTLTVCYASMGDRQSIMQNAQAGTACCLQDERVLEILLVLQLPAGSGVCDVGRYLPVVVGVLKKQLAVRALLCF